MNEPAQWTQADLAGRVSRSPGATTPVDPTEASQGDIIASLRVIHEVEGECW
jgi:hypothetical protein